MQGSGVRAVAQTTSGRGPNPDRMLRYSKKPNPTSLLPIYRNYLPRSATVKADIFEKYTNFR